MTMMPGWKDVTDAFNSHRTQATFDRLTANPEITSPELDERIERIANATDSRVTLYGIQESVGEGPSGYYITSDSRRATA